MIAQVRRARSPGCKFDQIIVLEGPEGTGKSSLLSHLAVFPGWFSDQTILGLSDQQQQERLRGVWVYEIADLTNVTKAEVEHVKAFASRTEDRARPAYGRALVALKRRNVIWATTNNHNYLRSQTGNRRFWPVLTSHIDIEAFRRDRDQLLAEATHHEAAGASIVLPRALWKDAAAEQELRREFDPWEDILEEIARGQCEDGEERVFSKDLLQKLVAPPQSPTPYHSQRLGTVMRTLGWDGPKVLRIGGRSARSAGVSADGTALLDRLVTLVTVLVTLTVTVFLVWLQRGNGGYSEI